MNYSPITHLGLPNKLTIAPSAIGPRPTSRLESVENHLTSVLSEMQAISNRLYALADKTLGAVPETPGAQSPLPPANGAVERLQNIARQMEDGLSAIRGSVLRLEDL